MSLSQCRYLWTVRIGIPILTTSIKLLLRFVITMLPYAECAAICGNSISLPSFFILSSIFFYGGYVLSSIRSKSTIKRLEGQLRVQGGSNEMGTGSQIVTGVLSTINNAFRANRQQENSPEARFIVDMFESVLTAVQGEQTDGSSSDEEN